MFTNSIGKIRENEEVEQDSKKVEAFDLTRKLKKIYKSESPLDGKTQITLFFIEFELIQNPESCSKNYA